MKAIVYTSNTGYTAAYAALLSDKTGLPAYTAEAAKKALPAGTEIIYMGWLCAGTVKGYPRAAKRYKVTAVCGVGLGDTGAQTDSVRKAAGIPAETPLFTLQGGMDHVRLRGINRFMINMLVKMLENKQRTADEEAMLALIKKGGNYVGEEHLAAVLEWYAGVEQ